MIRKVLLLLFCFIVFNVGHSQEQYADVILDSYSVDPLGFYGADILDFDNTGFMLVSTKVCVGNNTWFVSIRKGSYITVGFVDNLIFNAPDQNDIFIEEYGAASELADIFISSDNGVTFTYFGQIDGGVTNEIDLEDIGYTGLVNAIKIVGLDNNGTAPGFDVVRVYGIAGANCTANAQDSLPVLCQDSIMDLSEIGGTWTGDVLIGNMINTVDTGIFNLTHIVEDSIPGCPADTANIPVHIISCECTADAALLLPELCQSAIFDLNNSAGIWSGSILEDGFINTANTGNFQLTHIVMDPLSFCPNDTALVDVHVVPCECTADASVDLPQVCQDSILNLSSYGGGWTGSILQGNLINTLDTGTFFLTHIVEDQYAVCPSDTALVEVHIVSCDCVVDATVVLPEVCQDSILDISGYDGIWLGDVLIGSRINTLDTGVFQLTHIVLADTLSVCSNDTFIVDVHVVPCDCQGLPYGKFQIDACDICMDPMDSLFGVSCLDCAGVPFGNWTLDVCNQCLPQGDATRCSIDSIAYIPNVFSPNNDGINDLFAIYFRKGIEGEMIDFSIYSRWGELVYSQQSSSIRSNEIWWDGRINGQKAPTGVYIYHILAALSNGGFVEYSGGVTVVR